MKFYTTRHKLGIWSYDFSDWECFYEKYTNQLLFSTDSGYTGREIVHAI